jgi:hypothetical protein
VAVDGDAKVRDAVAQSRAAPSTTGIEAAVKRWPRHRGFASRRMDRMRGTAGKALGRSKKDMRAAARRGRARI